LVKKIHYNMERRAIVTRCKSQIVKEEVGNKQGDAVFPIIRIRTRIRTPIHISNYAANLSQNNQKSKTHIHNESQDTSVLMARRKSVRQPTRQLAYEHSALRLTYSRLKSRAKISSWNVLPDSIACFVYTQDTTMSKPIASSANSERLRKALTAFKHLKSLSLSAKEIANLPKLAPQKPYGLPGSRFFMQACKNFNINAIESMLEFNKWLAQSYDFMHLTALHWATKRKFLPVMEKLLDAGAYIDARDAVLFI
jgi:hypothetical protein